MDKAGQDRPVFTEKVFLTKKGFVRNFYFDIMNLKTSLFYYI